MADEPNEYAAVLSDLEVETLARFRHSQAADDAARRSRFYDRVHRFYAPPGGDQWPEDRIKRLNKFHITANIVKAFVDIESRILALMPKITNKPPVETPEARQKAETAEKLYTLFMDDNDFEVLLGDWSRTRSLYGRGAVKLFWDDSVDPGRPAARLIEQPQNLILGWGASDFSTLDWALYEYKLSPLEAALQYPDIEINLGKGRDSELITVRRGTDHSDPADQKGALGTINDLNTRTSFLRRYAESQYEKKQVTVWDYWYKNRQGLICNAQLVQGKLATAVVEHPEFPVIPYVVSESDHEPGSPEGMSTAELLLDLQMVLNVVLSLWTQVVADDTEPAWQLTGPDADESSVAGIVPKAGQIVAPGPGNRIEKIEKNINQYPAQALIQEVWNTAHRITGISEIMFGNAAASVDSARVLATQIEAAQNRLDPKRKRFYASIRQVFLIWGYMIEKKDLKITVGVTPEATAPGETPGVQAQEITVGEFLKGFNHWKIQGPEITPRDSVERTNDVLNKINGNLMPRIVGMDEIGIDSPEENMAILLKELSNPRLNPAAVQQFAAVLATLQAIEAQAQAQAGAASPEAAIQQGAGAEAQGQAAAQAAAPTGMEDQNSPATGIGSAPPPGASVPGGGIGATFEPLVRQTPGGQSQALSQITLPKRSV
jgi:hypothetical protein